MQDLQKKLEYYESHNGVNQGHVKLIKKLKIDKIALKDRLNVTRQNNAVLLNTIDQLKVKNEELEGDIQESEAKIANGTNEIAQLKKTIEDSMKKNKESEMKAEELEGKIEQLKMNESKLVSDLENCESNDADQG